MAGFEFVYYLLIGFKVVLHSDGHPQSYDEGLVGNSDSTQSDS